jgi:hypothetical protein
MHLVHLLTISKMEIKHKIHVDKNNFLHFQYIEFTSFKIKFPYLCTPSGIIYKQKSTKNFGPNYKQKSLNSTIINIFFQQYPYTCIYSFLQVIYVGVVLMMITSK